MTVLTIRAHRRYAVRQIVHLQRADERHVQGLMIELSSEGCRISNVKRGTYAAGDEIALEIGETRLHGRIRWAHDGVVGVRLDKALFSNQLSDLIAIGRGEDEIVRYGT